MPLLSLADSIVLPQGIDGIGVIGMSAIHNLVVKALNGEPLPLAQFKQKLLLVVNVASECGLTPQYAELQQLFERYAKQGLAILAVPCNQFGAQEPGTAEEIQAFCQTQYQIDFPLTEKMQVNEPGCHPLYRLLAGEGAEFPGEITWNFEKFLLDGQGRVLARFAPKVSPLEAQVIAVIEQELSSASVE